MDNQTKKAAGELDAAKLSLASAIETLESISTYNLSGLNCACRDGGPCAYHADLINRLTDAARRVDHVLAELRADIATPRREH